MFSYGSISISIAQSLCQVCYMLFPVIKAGLLFVLLVLLFFTKTDIRSRVLLCFSAAVLFSLRIVSQFLAAYQVIN